MLINEIKKGENKRLELKEKFPSSEAILNAIIHRDYLRNSDIKVAIYDDIVEITSPGGFPNGLTLQEVMSGRSEIRNKVLANLFKELKFVETWGSGVRKIQKLCSQNGIKFEINESGNFVTILFYRPESVKKPVGNRRKTGGKPANLTRQEEIIYDFIILKHKIELKDVENLLNVKSSRAREILSNLVKKDILEKIGKTKGSYYIFKSEK